MTEFYHQAMHAFFAVWGDSKALNICDVLQQKVP